MRHFLDLASWSTKDLWQLLQLAAQLKSEWQTGGNRPILAGKYLAMVFQKPSLRTRVSFHIGMKHLGGDAVMLGPTEIGLGQRESIADVARVLSGYTQCIMARVFEHEHVTQLAAYASVPVINGLSDNRHPCQAMADLLTIYEHYGRFKGLKVAYIGDGNNVAASLLAACTHFGMDLSIATPPGYEIPAESKESAARINGQMTFLETQDAQAALENADVVYTDTWVSMGQEDEKAERRRIFTPYQLNQSTLAFAKPTAIVMHDLPAYRGYEITDEVADGDQSVIFQQAENRLHAQKAILVKLMYMQD